MNILVFGEGGFVAGDLFELPSLLSDCLLHTASRGGYTLQRHISAARAHNRVWITLMAVYPDSQIFPPPSHWLTHYSFPLRHRAFWGLELSVQRVSRRWSWEGRSDFCSSRWHLPPRTPPGRSRWQCQTHSLWCSSLWGEMTKSKWPNWTCDKPLWYERQNIVHVWLVSEIFVSTHSVVYGKLEAEIRFLLRGLVADAGGYVPGWSAMEKLNLVGIEEPLELTAVTSSW